jgi:hypothetical protein
LPICFRFGNVRYIEKENAVEISEIREYIHTLKSNKALGANGIKAEIYQETSDITAPFLTQIIND